MVKEISNNVIICWCIYTCPNKLQTISKNFPITFTQVYQIQRTNINGSAPGKEPWHSYLNIASWTNSTVTFEECNNNRMSKCQFLITGKG